MDMHEQKKMKRLFAGSGFSPSPGEEKLFRDFYDLLVEYNDELDLSRLKRFDDIIIKHFIDSVHITQLIDLPSPLVDIGTGAGFPGIPLKLVNPDLHIILAEPRHKRVSFMNMVIDKLGLEKIEVYPHLVTDKSFFEARGVITRALESVDETLHRVSHFLPAGGKVIFMKGPGADKDKQELSEQNHSDYSLDHDMEYTLPGTGFKRRLLVYKRISSSLKKTYKIFINPDETIGFPISSKENKRFKELKKITSIEGIKKNKKIIISGKKQVTELLEQKDHSLENEYLVIFDDYVEDTDSFNEQLTLFNNSGKLLILKKSLFNELDTFSTGAPLLVAGLPHLEEWDFSLEQGCTLLIPFQDPANVGAVIRSAVGLGVNSFIMLRESASPFHPKSIRASAGAVFKAVIKKGPSIYSLPDHIEKHSLPVVALDKRGREIDSFEFPDRFLLLPGIEGPGLPDHLKSEALSIPLQNNIESLNAAIAASIALYEWRRRG
ncbi:MAG: 16S rRNA (guanine(527)-N(7))-methyltransferase RsmG [bacterium]|nr:16S rRNA (guanine(527)-N(7))-methyltransferase RsmG [bacterium]